MTTLAFTPRRRAASLLYGISLGYFMVLLDSTILNVALPDVSASLGGAIIGQQWTVNAYTVAFAALLLSSGAIADRYGASRVFRAGIIAFAVASLLCALAPSLWLLVMLRAIQGAAAAAIPASTLALIGQIYTDPAERGRAVGIWAATSGIGLAAGPLLGGVLVDLGGWRLIFLVNLPIALLCLVLTAGAGLRSPAGSRALDWRSQLAAVVFMGLLIHTAIEGSHRASAALAPAVLTVASLVVLIVIERRSAAPAFPLPIMRVPAIRNMLMAGLAVQFAGAGALFVLGLHFLNTLHFSPTRTGLAFLPMTLAPMMAPLVSRLMARYGPRRPMLAGLTMITVGAAAVILGISADASYPQLVFAMVITGAGFPFSLVPLTASLVTAAPQGTAGLAGGLFNAVRQLGAALGVALMGGLLAL